MRYSAFISYNHRDRALAAWLHKALETYVIPKRLRGRQSKIGVLGTKLPPIFQDREELAASSDLALSVREALEQAFSLIVICSPNGAKSRWVNEEIRVFTALGRRDRIQCLIVDGVPHASTTDGADSALESFPPALFENGGAEPLASDIRPGMDARWSAKLKLIAGIIGVNYDELRQREQARRIRRLAIVSGLLGVGFVFALGLAVFAFVSRNEAVRQRDIARQKTITAERTVDFVKSLFQVSDPSEAKGAKITAREILDRGAVRIDQSLNDEPSVKADLSTTLGEVYSGLGLFRRGDAIIRNSLLIKKVDPATRIRQEVAYAEARARQGDYQEAVLYFNRALAAAQSKDKPREELIPRILIGLGEARSAQDDVTGAGKLFSRALQIDLVRLGNAHPDVARDLEALGWNDTQEGRFKQGRSRLERALAIRLRSQGNLHPMISDDLTALGSIAYLQRDSRSAENYWRRALITDQKILGPEHPDVAATENNLALILLERRAFREAKPLLEHAVAVIIREQGDSFDDLAFEQNNLAQVYRGLGDNARAENLFRKALNVARVHKHRNLGPILANLAEVVCDGGDYRTGFTLLDESRKLMAENYPDDPWRVAWAGVVRGRCLIASGDKRKAAAIVAASRRAISERWPDDSLYGSYLRALLRQLGER